MRTHNTCTHQLEYMTWEKKGHTRTHTHTNTQMCTHNTWTHQLEYTTWEKKGHGNHKRIQELNKEVEAQRKVIDDMPLLPGDKDKKDRNTCKIYIYINIYVCISKYIFLYVFI